MVEHRFINQAILSEFYRITRYTFQGGGAGPVWSWFIEGSVCHVMFEPKLGSYEHFLNGANRGGGKLESYGLTFKSQLEVVCLKDSF